ncbi:MAG: hypothetical protein QM589_04160 [Thermomicrobiales bacterium]
MAPYKRKSRSGSSMVVLGGWLFADLLLGLAMLFAVATTVGAPPPTPTPTPAPNYLATSEANRAADRTSAQQTVAALQGDIANLDASAQQTQEALIAQNQAANARATEAAEAQATRDAMSVSERATADAQATQDAIVAQATIEALATQQAEANANSGDLRNQLATTEALATQNASANQDTEATITSLEDQIAQNQSSAATSEALSTQAAATVSAVQQDRADADATSEALATQVAAQSLNPSAVQETIQVDLNGVVAGDTQATADARRQLEQIFQKYTSGQTCQIGFVLISSGASDIGSGVNLSKAIANLISSDFPELLPVRADGSQGTLASESIALIGSTPSGEVQLELFFNTGCTPAG